MAIGERPKLTDWQLAVEARTRRAHADLAADAGSADVPDSGSQIVTRLSSASPVTEGQSATFWFDTDKILLFDPSSGANLTYSED